MNKTTQNLKELLMELSMKEELLKKRDQTTQELKEKLSNMGISTPEQLAAKKQELSSELNNLFEELEEYKIKLDKALED
jgi:hypothetical protein